MDDFGRWASFLVLLAVILGIGLLALVLSQIHITNKKRHRMPVQMRKRSCPTCALNTLVRQTPPLPLWVVAWYKCSRCEQDFWRYRWSNHLLRPQR